MRYTLLSPPARACRISAIGWGLIALGLFISTVPQHLFWPFSQTSVMRSMLSFMFPLLLIGRLVIIMGLSCQIQFSTWALPLLLWQALAFGYKLLTWILYSPSMPIQVPYIFPLHFFVYEDMLLEGVCVIGLCVLMTKESVAFPDLPTARYVIVIYLLALASRLVLCCTTWLMPGATWARRFRLSESISFVAMIYVSLHIAVVSIAVWLHTKTLERCNSIPHRR